MTPTASRSLADDQRDDVRQRREPVQHGARVGGGAHDRELLARVAPAPRVARDLAAEDVRDAAGQLAGVVEQQALARARLAPHAPSASSSRASVFGPIPGARCSLPASAASRSSSAVRTSSARASSTDAARAQAQVPPEPDEVGRELTLELGQLRDRAGLDQLAQPRRDALADAAQLAHAPLSHELGDGDGRGTDRVGRAPVRASGVGIGVRQLQQGGERGEALGDQLVLHRAKPSRIVARRGRAGRTLAMCGSLVDPSIAGGCAR